MFSRTDLGTEKYTDAYLLRVSLQRGVSWMGRAFLDDAPSEGLLKEIETERLMAVVCVCTSRFPRLCSGRSPRERGGAPTGRETKAVDSSRARRHS